MLSLTLQERIEKDIGIDFFEKFGEKEFIQAQTAYYHYLLGLGYMGKGKIQEAKDSFKVALKLNPYHVWTKVHLSELSKE